jgi:hypothetical protein
MADFPLDHATTLLGTVVIGEIVRQITKVVAQLQNLKKQLHKELKY